MKKIINPIILSLASSILMVLSIIVTDAALTESQALTYQYISVLAISVLYAFFYLILKGKDTNSIVFPFVAFITQAVAISLILIVDKVAGFTSIGAPMYSHYLLNATAVVVIADLLLNVLGLKKLFTVSDNESSDKNKKSLAIIGCAVLCYVMFITYLYAENSAELQNSLIISSTLFSAVYFFTRKEFNTPLWTSAPLLLLYAPFYLAVGKISLTFVRDESFLSERAMIVLGTVLLADVIYSVIRSLFKTENRPLSCS